MPPRMMAGQGTRGLLWPGVGGNLLVGVQDGRPVIALGEASIPDLKWYPLQQPLREPQRRALAQAPGEHGMPGTQPEPS